MTMILHIISHVFDYEHKLLEEYSDMMSVNLHTEKLHLSTHGH